MITLTTDFGLHDSYVAQLKGTILGINPDVHIVDVSHQVSPQNIIAASCLIDSAMDSFPPRTIHLIIVDPGVGSNRSIIATEINNQYWISPDNGLLTLPAKRFELSNSIHVTNPEYWRDQVSSTFHGRDIMAPVAAHLSLGVPLSCLGEKLTSSPVLIEQNSPTLLKNEIQGEVIHIDHFGNIITDIPESLLEQFSLTECKVIVNDQITIKGVLKYYDQKPLGELLSLFGSSGLLEIAVNQGNAAEEYHLDLGQKINVRLENE